MTSLWKDIPHRPRLAEVQEIIHDTAKLCSVSTVELMNPNGEPRRQAAQDIAMLVVCFLRPELSITMTADIFSVSPRKLAHCCGGAEHMVTRNESYRRIAERVLTKFRQWP